jgi:hypothetical protein
MAWFGNRADAHLQASDSFGKPTVALHPVNKNAPNY